jgi:hypothetical protein
MVTQRWLISFCLSIATAGVAAGTIFAAGQGSSSGAALIKRVKNYYEATRKKNFTAAQSLLAPDARTWFDKMVGDGDLWTAEGGTWTHWDSYFHGELTFRDWKADGNTVTATVHEINDYYRLLDWEPALMRWTWWFDESGRMKQHLIESLSGDGAPKNRMREFREWAGQHNPDELKYLMPEGHIVPTDDRPERWRKILVEWRKDTGLQPVKLGAPGKP